MPDTDDSWNLNQTISSCLETAHSKIDELMNALKQFGWEGRDAFHVHMSVEEALVNAIEHGNCSDESKSVKVAFSVSKSRVSIEIEDQGAGFCFADLKDPTEENNLEVPRGRGVLLIRELMTHAEYNERGNKIEMYKDRSVDVG